MKRVLVLDANQRSALSTTRSLGKRGITVITADESPTALAGNSRFSERYFRYPPPQTQPEKFIATITNLVRTQDIGMLLPMTELTTALLLQHREKFPDVTLPFPDLDTIECLSNKCSLMRLAESLDVPIPRTWYADKPGKLPFKLEDLPYPIVLKPGKSWIFDGNEWLHTSVQFANTPQQAREIMESDRAFHTHPFMLQECVPGTGQGLFALYDKGKPIAFFSHRRLREKPPWGGVSVLSESVQIDPILQRHARSLLDAVRWHGIAMVEFKVTDDGTPYLMEINTRFWGSLQLAIDAGVDFPWLLYQMAFGRPVETIRSYRTGIRLRWILGDFDSLYLHLRERGIPAQDKLGAILRFFTPAPFRTRHEVNRWNDLGPFWWEIKQYVRDLFG